MLFVSPAAIPPNTVEVTLLSGVGTVCAVSQRFSGAACSPAHRREAARISLCRSLLPGGGPVTDLAFNSLCPPRFALRLPQTSLALTLSGLWRRGA